MGTRHAQPEREAPGLLDRLWQHAARSPNRQAFAFLGDGTSESATLTFGELRLRVESLAATLRKQGLEPGERALLLFPPGLEFIVGFLGCLAAGSIAVPAYPVLRERGLSRLTAIMRDCQPRLVLTTAGERRRLAEAQGGLPASGDLEVLATDEIDPDQASGTPPLKPHPDTIAFLQYTSGSTAAPRGVCVSHGNLLHNEEMIRRAFGQTGGSVIVSWLPLYHDMGLIGGVLQPLYLGARCVLLSPLAFLKQPVCWLRAISTYRASTSGGPDFAYSLAARKVTEEDKANLDLGSWRLAFNGAEPVRASTLEHFARAFASCGFRPEAFYPCYGLAEATLFATGGRPGRGARLAHLDAAALAAGGARKPRGGHAARSLVSCGRPLLGQRVAIVDPETLVPQSAGRVGEIWLSGASIAQGYWRRPEETAATFGATLAGEDGAFLRTGDLGFLQGGDLYVTGRLKDLIILRGRKLYPQDLEATAEGAHAALRPGCSAAFALEEGEGEAVILVLEVERQAEVPVEEVASAVRRALATEHEVRLSEVVLIRHGSLPKTSSGKVQRGACRHLYLAGKLQEVGRSRLSTQGAEPALANPPAALGRQALLALPLAEREAALRTRLATQLPRPAGAPPEAILDLPLTSLGLDSLAAAELQQRLSEELGSAPSLSDLLAGTTVRSLARELAAEIGAGGDGEREVWVDGAGTEGELTAPASPGQASLWFIERLAGGGSVYNLAAAARLPAGFDRGALAGAVHRLSSRHPALRTSFRETSEGLVQRVAAAPRLDLALLEGDLEAAAWEPFDLALAPLVRWRHRELPGGETLLLFVAHHAIVDFWSLGVLLTELAALYRAEAEGQAPPHLPPALSPLAVSRRQREELAGPRGEALWRYWRAELEPLPPPLNLPTDRPRPPLASYRGHTAVRLLAAEIEAKARQLAERSGTTLFTVLLSAFQLLLARLSGARHLAVGSPAIGREGAALAGVVGYLANPLVLAAEIAADESFEQLVSRQRLRVLGALAHQDLPFPLLAERLAEERSAGRSPLFDVLFVLDRSPLSAAPDLAAFAAGLGGATVEVEGLRLTSVDLLPRRAPFDLTLRLVATGRVLTAVLTYATDLFDGVTIERWLGSLEVLLGAALATPARPCGRLDLLSAAEREELLRERGAGRALPPSPPLLPNRFLVQAAATPESVGLTHDESWLSYAWFEERVAGLAAGLAARGVGPEVRVAVEMERTAELVVALLAILTAGGAYVPIDPAYPAPRRAFMVSDARATLVLTAELATSFTGEVQRKAPPPLLAPAMLAYSIYTSGSTGEPKAVAVTHGGVAALLAWADDTFTADELRCVLAATSICFDISVFELFAPLVRGGRVLLAPQLLALPEQAAASGLTLINTVPSPMRELLELAELPVALRTVNLAGEALSRQLAARVHARAGAVRLLNLYGPTEDTVYATVAEIAAADPSPAIGRPIAGGCVRVSDSRGELVPVGVPGELYLGGAGLARGYLGRPGATAARFLPDPFGAGRLYRTGDLARWRGDGQLEFLGRLDLQVKVRGFRVELREIEAALERHPEVAAAVVLERRDLPGAHADRATLVAYWVPRTPAGEGSEPEPDFPPFLGADLPAFAVPSAFVRLATLPQTRSGKLDRSALPRPTVRGVGLRGGTFNSVLEELLGGVFAELLGVEGVTSDSSFFVLGGHSLLATRLLSRLRDLFGVELPLAAVFQAPTVAALAERIRTLQALALPAPAPIPPAPRDGELPLSFAQQRLWLASQSAAQAPAYHVPLAVRLDGPLAVAPLKASLEAIVARHEALRTAFPLGEEGPVQQPLARLPFRLPVVDLARLEAAAEQARHLAAAEARRPFDLARGPLLRARLLRLGGEVHHLLLTFHHLVTDGWSLGILLAEVPHAYGAALRGEAAGSGFAPLPIQAVDHAVWERGERARGAFAADLEAWRAILAGLEGSLELPRDRPRPAAATARGAVVERLLSAELTADVAALGRREGATLFMVLLAAFDGLLFRLTAAPDLAVGTPIANRRSSQLEGLMGCFVNTLVMRVAVTGDLAFRDLVGRVRRASLAAYAHQALPFELLVEELRPPREGRRHPFFQVLFVLQDAPLPELALPGLNATLLATDAGAAQFDLSLAVREEGGRLSCMAEYSSELFDATTVLRWLMAFETLLRAATTDPGCRLGELTLLTPAERAQSLAEWNDTAVAAAAPDLLAGIAATAARQPEALALVAPLPEGPECSSYGHLRASWSRLAARLGALGVGAESRVGVAAERTSGTITSFLGVLAAGAAYVPIDLSNPAARLSFLVADAGLRFLLVSRPGAAGEIRGLTLLRPETGEAGPHAPLRIWPEASAAYILYTSGTTGEPKGVVISRQALAHSCHHAADSYALAPGDRALQFAALSFDASAEEIYPTLLRGATLWLRDEAMMGSHERFGEELERFRISVLNLPTAFWRGFTAALAAGEVGLAASLRLVVIGGEKAEPELLAAWRKRTALRLANTYGPTEATIVTHASEQGGPSAGPGDLGRPRPGATAFLTDQRRAPVAIGVPGELLLGGPTLARGYLGRPALTAASFVPDPWSGRTGERLFTTGDLARTLADGSLAFAGRRDRQIKVRGIRVELGEIESALTRLPEVRTAAVILSRADGDGEGRLLAAVVPQPGVEVSTVGLRAALAAELPPYMLPAALTLVPALPLSAHGKVDERALAALATAATVEPENKPRERAPVEEIVAGIWAEVLGLEAAGIAGEADFFALGGHSLRATQVGSRLRRRLGVELPFDTLFQVPTLGAFAVAVEAALHGELARPGRAIPRSAGAGPYRLSFSQERLWFLDRLYGESPAYTLAGGLHLVGEVDVRRFAACLARLGRRHDVLRTFFGTVEGEARQWVVEGLTLATPLIDLTGLPAAGRTAAAVAAARRFAARRFDLGRPPLLRALFLRRAAGDHDFLLALHHIIGDGWTTALLSRELTELYARGPDAALPPLPIRYGDYAEWQRGELSGTRLASLIAYWRGVLAPPLPGPALRPDRPRPAVASFEGALVPFALPPGLGPRLAALARAEGATLFMVLLAAFDLVLARWSGATEVVVGTNVANRSRQETENIAGFFVNSLPLRVALGGDPTFRELVARLRAVALGAYAHQDLPFHRLVEELRVRHDPGTNPFFQVMFLLQNTPPAELELPGLEQSPLIHDSKTTAFDLTLSLEADGRGELAGSVRYGTDLFEPPTIARLIHAWSSLLAAVVERPGDRLSEFAVPTLKGETPMNQHQKLSKLLGTKPRSIAPTTADLVRGSTFEGRRLPWVIEPALAEVDLAGWIEGHRGEVEGKLAEHGAVLFRGFGILNLERFEGVARALSGRLVEYSERSSPRTALAAEVYTSTDHPADQSIVLHNEQSYTLNWPLKIWFGCLTAARVGGATPLADSRRILARLEPSLVERFERLGVMYVRTYGNGLGLSWQQAFQTSDPRQVEAHCRAAGIEVAWGREGRLRTRQVRPAVRRHPKTGERTWFNHAVFFHVSSLDPRTRDALLAGLAEEDLPFNTLYGDGTPIEPAALATIRAAMAAETVSFLWQAGDALVVDNMLVAHGREPFEGPRKVVVAMAEPAAEWLAETAPDATEPVEVA